MGEFVSFQHMIMGSKQTSFRIMRMEMYAIMDKVKHNTANTKPDPGRSHVTEMSLWQ
jgi:hypothetical protein